MASLLALLQHMVDQKISPLPEKGKDPELPTWMTNLKKKMEGANTAINIKLFLAKLILNCQHIFQPYARFWLLPLMQLITSGVMGNCMNYMVLDLVALLLSWADVSIPDQTMMERSLANQLLEFLMENAAHSRKDVFRHNLEVIRSMVEVWKPCLDVPVKVIFEQLANPATNSRDNAVGIQLLGVVLANNLPPYTSSTAVHKKMFLHALSQNLGYYYREVYDAAAEVTGMALRYLDKEGKGFCSDDDKAFCDSVIQQLSVLANNRDQFLICLYRIQKHYPLLVGRFLNNVLFMLPSSHGPYRTCCLEIILSGLEEIQDVFLQMRDRGILELLENRDSQNQDVILHIVNKMASHLLPEQLQAVLPTVCKFITHPSKTCRQTMYQILMWVYDKYSSEKDDDEVDKCLVKESKRSLLQGLSDTDPELRLSVYNFWSAESRLPSDTSDRLYALLTLLYNPDTEANFLNYSTFFLLERSFKSPDYNRKIFEKPLSECQFQEYNLSTSWRFRHATMTPLFVETLTSQSQNIEPPISYGESLQGQVRATQQTVAFTATQDIERGQQAFNWVTQSSVNTSDVDTAMTVLDSGQATSSALLFTIGSNEKRLKSYKQGPEFGKKKMQTAGTVDTERKSQLQTPVTTLLKRRFLKNTEKRSIFFAKREIRKSSLRLELQKERRARREAQITMYRKYRIGDFPDIEINYSAIIAPLQALAQRDTVIARILFVSLFNGIFKEVQEGSGKKVFDSFKKQAAMSLNHILQETVQYDPAVIGAVIEIGLSNVKHIKLNAEDVSTVAKTSNLQCLGILLLEEGLIQHVGGETESKRARKAVKQYGSEDTIMWLKLAELYKSIDDYDMLRGIFSQKIGCQEITQRALEAEAAGNWKTAQTLYLEALDTYTDNDQVFEAEKDLWEEAYYLCLEHLSQWDGISKNVDNKLDSNLQTAWKDSWSKEHVLPWLIRSKLHMILEKEKDDGFLTFVDACLMDKLKKEYLETHFTEELAMLYTVKKDYDRAQYYCSMNLTLLLDQWAQMSPLAIHTHKPNLHNLQKISELQSFIEVVRQDENQQSGRPAQRLVDGWIKQTPFSLDPLPVWDTIMEYRNLYLRHLKDGFEFSFFCGKSNPEAQVGRDKESIFEHLEDGKVSMALAVIRMAFVQKNVSVALKYLKTTLKMQESTNEKLKIEWCHAYAYTNFLRSKVHEQRRRIKWLLDAWKKLDVVKDTTTLKSDLLLRTKQLHISSDIMTEIADTLSSDPNCLQFLENEFKKELYSICDNEESVDNMVITLSKKGFSYIHDVLTALEVSTTYSNNTLALAHLKLVKYCLRELENLEEKVDVGKRKVSTHYRQYPAAIVKSLLLTMKHGSEEGRRLFPTLLQMMDDHPEVHDVFKETSQEVPMWMFLGWVSQLLACLDTQLGPVVGNILLQLAEMYPNALFFPFQISSGKYKFKMDEIGKQCRSITEKIQSKLTVDSVLTTLMKSLFHLGQPELILKDYIKEMHDLKQSSKDTNHFQEIYSNMYSELFEGAASTLKCGTACHSGIPSIYGEVLKKFCKKYKKHVDDIFGDKGCKLSAVTLKTLQQLMQQLKQAKIIPSGLIKDYSIWLSEFQAAKLDADIEIPGQYTGESKPMPQYHVRISRFDPKVQVMSSLRKPMKITIFGNDTKEYRYLVKFGEDLRQDQRIEQLFNIMNGILANDPICQPKQLSVATYQVVPLTSRLGLIEWIDHTVPLKELIYSAMTDSEKNLLKGQNNPNNHMNNCLKKASKGNHSQLMQYMNLFLNCSTKDTARAFEERVNMLPWDLLRRAFHRLSSSPEGFYILRHNFVSSYAVVCVCQWLLGIGDRHLSNIMVSKDTGQCIGIDFGYAFGTATQFTPIPELMPCRITPQIQNLMLPMKEAGTVRETMIHTLRALRNNDEILLATMDVFIKEPSVDWLSCARMQAEAKDKRNVSDEDLMWYPREKISMAKQKLKGAKPAAITVRDLKAGHRNSIAYRQLIQVVSGDQNINSRARMQDDCLTVEQQVECLIDQATDASILGRTWAGWEPWV